MIDIVKTVAGLDENFELHLSRILILLDSFAGSDGTGTVNGITKLAKLDFLLRYPVMLERALKAKNRSIQNVKLEDHELKSVESTMVRYRFGPWDHRYREFINLLIAKGLATVDIEGRTTIIGITADGREIASNLKVDILFEPYVRRSKLLNAHFDLTSTNLMQFIYSTFPEILSLRPNEPIRV